MEAKPRKVKVWYQALDICLEVDRALIEALDEVGYNCGDVGSYIGDPRFIVRDMEFIRKDLEEYPEDEEVRKEPGTLWVACTLEDYEVEELRQLLTISQEAMAGSEYEETTKMVAQGLIRKLGLNKVKD